MKNTMKAAVYLGLNNIEIQEVPLPRVQPMHVLINIARTGICGTDLSIFAGKHPRAKAPLIMGHELVGKIVDIGDGITRTVEIGDNVSANPLLWCGKCRSCMRGTPHICNSLNLIGIDIDGGFAEYVNVSADRVHKLNENVDWDHAALAEPLAVSIHAIRNSKLTIGNNVVVIGAGPIGILVGYIASLSGAQNVWILDVNPIRLNKAVDFNLIPININQQEPKGLIWDATNGIMADIVFECSGNIKAITGASDYCATSGEVVFVGIPADYANVNVPDTIYRELSYNAVRVYTNEEFGVATQMLSDYKIDISNLVSDVIALDDIQKALEKAKSGEGLKYLIKIADI